MFSKIKNTIDQLIEKYGTSDPEELCHRMNIVLLDCDLPDVTKGFCFTLSQGRAIVLNNTLQRGERRTCIAHELGHVTGRYENEADTFAAMLLLWNSSPLEGITTEQLAKKYHLPEKAVEKALANMQ